MAFERMRVFTGNANPKLAEAVVKHMNISLGRCIVGRFSDGEVMVELLENVRGRDIFILQSTCAPTNDNLMEILVMVDALKPRRRGESPPRYRISLRPPGPPTAISSGGNTARSLPTIGHRRGPVMTMDLHADRFRVFSIPVDNIYATPALLGDL
jgi:ribose-phosphate pyrophosphokinase